MIKNAYKIILDPLQTKQRSKTRKRIIQSQIYHPKVVENPDTTTTTTTK